MNNVMIQSTKKRARARKFAMQALYGWLIAANDIKDVEKFYRADRSPKNYDEQYFIKLIHNVTQEITAIDEQLVPFLDRKLKEVDPIELTILRIATYELLHILEIPFRVVIQEAISLANEFGSDQSYKFINNTLDKMSQMHRSHEYDMINKACS